VFFLPKRLRIRQLSRVFLRPQSTLLLQPGFLRDRRGLFATLRWAVREELTPLRRGTRHGVGSRDSHSSENARMFEFRGHCFSIVTHRSMHERSKNLLWFPRAKTPISPFEIRKNATDKLELIKFASFCENISDDQ
jgi:hypothetical protein